MEEEKIVPDDRDGNVSRIRNVVDFLSWNRKSVLKKFGIQYSTSSAWYRGHSSCSWVLQPSLYRCEVDHIFEREMLRDFKLYAAEMLEHKERTSVDWLFIAQHYGLPTRLLDWTENPLVALFFAVKDFVDETDGEIWALNPWEMNKAVIENISVPTTDSDIFGKYVIDLTSKNIEREISADLPLAVRPYHTFRRSNAQSGMFTIHGKIKKPLEKSIFMRRNKSSCITNVVVSGKHKLRIMRELHGLGITHANLFQNLDHLTKTIRFRYSDHFLRRSVVSYEIE